MGTTLNPIALRTAKTQWSFDRSECNGLKQEFAFTERGGKNENGIVSHSEC